MITASETNTPLSARITSVWAAAILGIVLVAAGLFFLRLELIIRALGTVIARDELRVFLPMDGVIAQHLCKRASAEGRIGVLEIMLQSYAVANMIRENKLHQLDGYLRSADPASTGMQSLDTCLLNYIRQGLVTAEEASKVANHPDEFKRLVAEHSDEVIAS